MIDAISLLKIKKYNKLYNIQAFSVKKIFSLKEKSGFSEVDLS
jgi:hypothetical protein